MSSPEETNAGPVIRDLRRIDPRTGQVRSPGADAPGTSGPGPGKPARPGKHSVSKPGPAAAGTGSEAAAQPAPDGAPAAAGPAGAGGRPAGGGAAEPGGVADSERELAAKLAERTADLQRVSAEYANYRKRVERDRLAVREQALADVLSSLLPVLDNIGLAREHGELTGGFEKVAGLLDSIVTKLGLVAFGTEGEPFDPRVHDARDSTISTEVTEPTCVQIMLPGYKVGERILRPAQVKVANPDDSAAPSAGAHEPPTGGEAGAQESREDED
jgi:molecular chaperone GrpE